MRVFHKANMNKEISKVKKHLVMLLMIFEGKLLTVPLLHDVSDIPSF